MAFSAHPMDIYPSFRLYMVDFLTPTHYDKDLLRTYARLACSDKTFAKMCQSVIRDWEFYRHHSSLKSFYGINGPESGFLLYSETPGIFRAAKIIYDKYLMDGKQETLWLLFDVRLKVRLPVPQWLQNVATEFLIRSIKEGRYVSSATLDFISKNEAAYHASLETAADEWLIMRNRGLTGRAR